MKVNLLKLMDEKACYDFLREIRWADGVQCPGCSDFANIKNGHNEIHKNRQKYECNIYWSVAIKDNPKK
jgi:hypothetical protein